jgi:aminopeptidase N
VKDKLSLGTNLTTVMLPWLTQMGFPVVTMERVDTVTVKLTQQLFLQNPQRPLYESYPPPYKYVV